MKICLFLGWLHHSPIPRLAIVVLIALIFSAPSFCAEIHNAARDGDLEKIKMLIKGNPELVSSKDSTGYTPLHYAVEEWHKDVAELLLANNADVNAKGAGGKTPLHYAIEERCKDVAELLLANKADVNAKDKNGRTPLHYAVEEGHRLLPERLVPSKAAVNANGTGERFFQVAARSSRKDMVELLLANKADVMARNRDGETPLRLAARNGPKDVELLLANKADVTANSFPPVMALTPAQAKDRVESQFAAIIEYRIDAARVWERYVQSMTEDHSFPNGGEEIVYPESAAEFIQNIAERNTNTDVLREALRSEFDSEKAEYRALACELSGLYFDVESIAGLRKLLNDGGKSAPIGVTSQQTCMSIRGWRLSGSWRDRFL
jgi:ankyrin repeat protein